MHGDVLLQIIFTSRSFAVCIRIQKSKTQQYGSAVKVCEYIVFADGAEDSTHH